jgi:hypothetical protein
VLKKQRVALIFMPLNDDIDQFFLLHPDEQDKSELAFEADRSALSRYCKLGRSGEF